MFRSRQPYFSSIRRLLQLPLIHNIPLYLLGPWGAGSQAVARVLIALAYRAKPQGGEFVRIDSMRRLANSPTYCGRALGADEQLPPPFADELTLCVDAIRGSDPFANKALPESRFNSGQGPNETVKKSRVSKA